MLLCFDTMGIFNKATSFDVALYERNRHRHFLLDDENDHVRASEVREIALRHGRGDVASLVDSSMRRLRRVER